MGIDLVAAWVLTLSLHAGVLLLAAWLVDRGALRTMPAWRELLWRVALFGALASASAQALLGSPLSPQLPLPVTAQMVSVPSTIERSAADSVKSNSQPESASALARVAHPATVTAQLPVAARTATASSGWSRVVVAAWLAGVVLTLLRVAFHWLQLQRALARARASTDPAIDVYAAALASHARIATPRVALLPGLASPIAASGARIVLPLWVADALDHDQMQAMLAHEIAHLARRDPAWKLATAICCAWLWFLPTLTARRRLDELAELSCDAWAVRHLGNGRALAECLAECAGRCGDFDPVLAPAMASRASPFLQRIDHLLEGHPMNMRLTRTRALAAVLLSLLLCAGVLPGFTAPAGAQPAPPSPPARPVPPAPPRLPVKGDGTHIHISRDAGLAGETTLVEVGDDQHSYSATIHGRISFNDSDDDVASLAEGGTASFVETRAGVRHRVDYANRGGQLERRYFVDDREQAVDAAGREWLARIIATLVRESAIDVEGRVQRLRAKGGADAVLEEIARIESGYARGAYLKQLAAGGTLSSTQVTRALGLVDGIDSDYERRNALSAIGSSQSLDAAQQKLVIEQAGKVESDYERAELLTALLPKLAPDAGLRSAWLAAANGIDSDFEHRRALSALLATNTLDDDTLATVIDAAKTIGSDFERRTLLADAIEHARDADRLADVYVAGSTGIGSDFEHREALLALMHASGFGHRGARAVLDAAGSIGSDHECSELLVALAQVMPGDADLIERYRAAARRLGDFERAAAERALDRFAG